MDFKFCGLIDIILVVAILISGIVGFKKGFLNKVISLIGFLAILIFAIFSCSAFAGFLIDHNIIYGGLQAKFEANILAQTNGAESAEDCLAVLLNVNTTMANFLLRIIKVEAETNIPEAVSIAVATFVMKAIAFAILFVGGLLAIGICKIVASFVRKNQVIRVIDGILGALLYIAITAVIIAGLFTLLYLVTDTWHWLPENAVNWIHTDLHVTVTEGEVGLVVKNNPNTLSGAIYASNPFMAILRVFGVK